MPTLRPFAALAALALAAAPAAAQTPAAHELSARHTGKAAAPTAAIRPVATLRFAGWRDGGMPAAVVLADSLGTLVARVQGARGAASPMLVTVLEREYILQGETPAGVFTVRLDRQDDPAAGGPVTGQWWLDGRGGGTFRGVARRTEVATR